MLDHYIQVIANSGSFDFVLFFILNHGRSIMAVSSWNDNGQKQFVHDPCKFFSNFLPF